MSRKDIQLLILVMGILVAVLSWQFVYNPNMEDVEQLNTENEDLRNTVAQLEALQANKDQYLQDTEDLKLANSDIINKFPAGFEVEDETMYLYNMENIEQNHIAVPSIGFGSVSQIPYTGNTSVDGYELTDDGIVMNTVQDNISFTTTYTGLKNTIQYIYKIPGRKSISSVSLSAGSDGYLTGSMSVDFYSLTGTDKVYVPTDIPNVRLGKDNIFGVLDEN